MRKKLKNFVMLKLNKAMAVLFVACLFALFFPHEAFAIPNCTPGEVDTLIPPAPNTLEQIVDCCNNPLLPGFFYKIHTCTSNIIVFTTNDFYNSTLARVADLIKMILVIAVVFLGYKMITSAEGDRKQDSIILMVKIGFIWMFLYSGVMNVTSVADAIRDATEYAASLVANAASVALGGPVSDNIWQHLDNTYIEVKDNMVPGTGTIISVAVALVFMGPLGITVLSIILGLVITVIISFLTVIYIYFTALIAIAFLVAIAPAIIPLVVFKKQSIARNAFEKWLGLIVTYSLQPVVLGAYIALMLVVIDGSLGNVADPDSLRGILSASSFSICMWTLFGDFGIPYFCWDLNNPPVWSNLILQLLVVLMIKMACIAFMHQIPSLMRRLVDMAGGAPDIAGKAASTAAEMGNKYFEKFMGGAEKAPDAIKSAIKYTGAAAFKGRGNKKR